MSRACTSLIHLALMTHLYVAAQTPEKCVVRGVLPPSARLEFLAQGSPDRLTAAAGDTGKYSIELPPARYEVTLILSNGKRQTGFASIRNPETTINAEAAPSGKSPAVTASAQEYDLLADWTVTDKAKRGIAAAKVSLDAELTNGRTEKLTVWVLAGLGDEEKETEGAFQTTPDGRAIFRVRESRLRLDRVMALIARVEAPGHAAVTARITPVLEFSSSGHFHAVYPEQYEIIVP
jgi:hypothetical protein